MTTLTRASKSFQNVAKST